MPTYQTKKYRYVPGRKAIEIGPCEHQTDGDLLAIRSSALNAIPSEGYEMNEETGLITFKTYFIPDFGHRPVAIYSPIVWEAIQGLQHEASYLLSFFPGLPIQPLRFNSLITDPEALAFYRNLLEIERDDQFPLVCSLNSEITITSMFERAKEMESRMEE